MAKPARKDNRGGPRPGSGRPKETLSVRQVKAMMNKAKARAKAEGCEIDDILLNFIYGEDGHGKKVGVRERIACIKLWKEYTSPKLTEGGEADQNALPNIYLPAHRDEGKVVPIDK